MAVTPPLQEVTANGYQDTPHLRPVWSQAPQRSVHLQSLHEGPLLLADRVPQARQVMKLLIINETNYDGRSVNACVRHSFRELDLDGRDAVVKVKYHRGGHAYQGRFYPGGNAHAAYLYDWRIGDYKRVGPVIPPGYRFLLVCRIGRPSNYPCSTHVYDRRDSPGTWIVEDWREALVSIVGHEAMHLKQHLISPKGKRGRFNEIDTEWAAYRMWLRWRERHA